MKPKRNHGRSRSLSQTILRWMLGSLVLVFLGMGFYQYQLLSQSAEVDYRHQAQELFTAVKKTLTLVFDENLSKLDAVSRSSEVQKYLRNPATATNVAAVSDLLNSVLKATPYSEGVTIIWLGDPVSVKTLDGKKADIGVGGVLANSTAELIGRNFGDREYSKKIQEGKEVWLSTPTISRASGKPNVVLAKAIPVDGQVKAFVVMSFALEFFTQSFVDDVTIGSGYLFLVHESGVLMAHPDKKLILNPDPGPTTKTILEKVLGGTPEFVSTVEGDPKVYMSQKWQYHDSTAWSLVFARPQAEIYANAVGNIGTLAAIFVGIFVLVWIVVTVLIRNSVTRPVRRFTKSLAEIASGGGDLTQTMPVLSHDEIGQMAEQFNLFQEGLRLLVDELKQDMGQVGLVAAKLLDNAGYLASAVVELASTTKTVAAHAETQRSQTQVASSNLAAMTEESSRVTAKVEQMDRSLTESSSAIEEMSANIRAVADRAKSNDEAGEVLVKTMDHGNEVVVKLQDIVRTNAQTSHQIQDMIQVIMQIAAQTNLLAMNAAIEAAHAGDAGRGFAVVAEEIRKLADQSAGSAKQIQTTVKRIAEGFDAILKSTEATGQEFTVLKGEIERVRLGSREIALAMAEQQVANDSVLESTSLLTRLSAEARSSIQAQFRSTEAVSVGVHAVADLSLQVARATVEESTALDETARLGEDVQQLARELNEVTEKVQAAFRSFKTKDGQES